LLPEATVATPREKIILLFSCGMADAEILVVMTHYEYAGMAVLLRFIPFGNVIHQDLESHRVLSIMSSLCQQAGHY
jgi:hypothetical protein